VIVLAIAMAPFASTPPSRRRFSDQTDRVPLGVA
jgi:hypothetical protein